MNDKPFRKRIDPRLARGLVVAGLGGVALALTGTFQTGEVSLVHGLAYWFRSC